MGRSSIGPTPPAARIAVTSAAVCSTAPVTTWMRSPKRPTERKDACSRSRAAALRGSPARTSRIAPRMSFFTSPGVPQASSRPR